MDIPEINTGNRRDSEPVKPDSNQADFLNTDSTPGASEGADVFADLPEAVDFPGIKQAANGDETAAIEINAAAVSVAKGSPTKSTESKKIDPKGVDPKTTEAKPISVAKPTVAKPAGAAAAQGVPVAKGAAAAAKPVTKNAANAAVGSAKKVATATAAVGAGGEEEGEAPPPGRKFMLFMALPSWMVSMLVHMLLVLVLALMTFSEDIKATAILTVASGDSDGKSEIEQFDIEDAEPPTMEESSEDEPTVELPPQMAAVQPVAIEAPTQTNVAVAQPMDFSVSNMSTESLTKSIKMSTATLSSRSTDMKKQLLKRYGGSDASEAAVADALDWIARHQMRNGGWTYEHNRVCNGQCDDPGERTQAFNAATAMAILPFLGAGQTHKQGKYKDVVAGGLRFLVSNIKLETDGLPRGKLVEAEGNMYSHGLAAITLCEAYAMTEDPELQRPAQAVINYIIFAQDPRGGGWRYSPKQPGDTSVVGWQLMALKSAYMAHLQVPPETLRGANSFLDFVSTNKGAYYGYDKPTTGKPPATTAIGLLCRMYMGWDRNSPGVIEGAKFLSQTGVDKKDIYYDYYAAQVLRHYGGPEWEKFNSELRDWLVSTQERKGHSKGSWHFPESKSHRGPIEGGRLASTSFATMILEVYYRHMPLYGNAAAEDDFPL